MCEVKAALVAGASGIVGNAVTEVLTGLPEWRVRVIRRSHVPIAEALHCDLFDANATAHALRGAGDTTHLFYAAYRADPNPQKSAEINTRMLRNVLDGLRAAGATVQRVVYFQGVKVYGAHLGASMAPFYEDDPRHLPVNFYFAQEDLLRERARQGEFEWSILRPDAVIGDTAGNPMNIALVLGAFAALSRQEGIPLRFPGSYKTYREVFSEMTDARWLAKASVWAALAPSARNEAFNIVGEPFRWERLWHKLGAALDMEVAEPQPFSMALHMPHRAAEWQRMITERQLQPIPYDELVHWGFGDAVLNMDRDMVSDMGKIRRAGFVEPMNTEDALVQAIRRLQARRYIP
ncbi:SDR family oxidoreductase [Paraburkholderia sediminicola]|uniref:SDR family oxidoreductase n=1 Tax=Paraburkholderia sediminicola TaxID=458836 RepID=UPI0038BD6153